MSGATRRGRRPPASRFLDITLATLGIVILMPVFVAIALTIQWRDGSPVLFRQTRVGRKGQLFRILKFRTMRRGSGGPAVTSAGDKRVTAVGSILRKYKLDELPQLFNVLLGDMSLVGPRPEVPDFVERGTPLWDEVLQVRPGITDLATLLYKNEEELFERGSDPELFYRECILPAKLAVNLSYLRTRSFGRDLRLIWLTIRYSLFTGGFDPELIRNRFRTGAENGARVYSFSSTVDR